MPPYDYGASQNVPLLLGIRRHVPEDASVSFLPRGGLAEQRLFVATGWIRWVGFVIAPRLVDAGVRSPWVVLVASDAAERRDPAAPGVALRPRTGSSSGDPRARRHRSRAARAAAARRRRAAADADAVPRRPRRLHRRRRGDGAAAAARTTSASSRRSGSCSRSACSCSRSGLRSALAQLARPRIEWLPLAVLSVPLVLLAARGAEKPVDTYDAFANWTLKAKLLYFDRELLATRRSRRRCTASIRSGCRRSRRSCCTRSAARTCACCTCCSPVFLGGLALVAWHVLRPHVSTWPLVAGLSLVLWMPAARDQALTALADRSARVSVRRARSCSSAAASSRSARSSPRPRWRRSATRSRSSPCSTRVSFAAVLVRRERDRLAPLAVSAFCVGLTAVPWQIYDARHDLHDHDVAPSQAHLGRARLRAAPHRAASLRAGVPVGVADRRGRGRRDARASARPSAGARGARARARARRGARRSSTSAARPASDYLVRSTVRRTLLTPTLLAAALLPLLVTRALGARPPAAARARDGTPPRSTSAAAARTSSTPSGRSSSRAIVVNVASSSPHAVIHSRERRGVEVDVERVAVRRDPPGDVHADRRDLARRRREPDAGEPLDPLRVEAERARACG